MNLYAMLSLIALVINSYLGIYVLYRNPKRIENRVFALLMAAFAIWDIGESLDISAVDESTALFWVRVLWTGVSFLGCIFLHLALSFPRERKILGNKLIYPVLYLPGFIFLHFTWATDLLISGVQSTYWAMYYQAYGPVFTLYSIYFEIALFIGLYLFWGVYKTSKVDMEKKQAKYMLIATAMPIIGGSVTNVILPTMGVYMFPIASFLTAIMGVVISYAIVKYRVMSLMPIALENVVESMTDGVMITDAFGYVARVNPSIEYMLGINSNALGRKFREIMSSLLPYVVNPGEFKLLLDKADTPLDSTISSQIILKRSAKQILDVAISPVRDKRGGIIGQITIFHDITEMKEAEGELKKKMGEFERFNKLMVGREVAMAELKKRVAELEGKG